MKKILSAVLVLVFIFVLCSCEKTVDTEAPSNAESVADTSNASSESETQKTDTSVSSTPQKPSSAVTSSAPKTASDYTKIPCRKALEISWKEIKIKCSGIDTKLKLSLPSDWSVASDSKGGYSLTRAGKNIGTLSLKEPADPDDFFEFDIESDLSGGAELHRYTQTNWNLVGSNESFSRAFEFVCGPGTECFTAYLTVDYAELDDVAADMLFDNAKATIDYNFKSLYHTNGSKEILILGNSFIGSSQIGEFLNDMLRGTGYTARTYSRGYAEVGTYANDSYLCSEIQNGNYCYVFQCGFYSDSAVSDFTAMKNTCDDSNTPIVIFPAHNEYQPSINLAKEQYSATAILDWKAEIDNLINSGVEYWDFCIDDSHRHSTPLAGYVGAHMIYSVLFGEAPSEIINSPLTMSQVRAKLGDYVDKGGMYAPLQRQGI